MLNKHSYIFNPFKKPSFCLLTSTRLVLENSPHSLPAWPPNPYPKELGKERGSLSPSSLVLLPELSSNPCYGKLVDVLNKEMFIIEKNTNNEIVSLKIHTRHLHIHKKDWKKTHRNC